MPAEARITSTWSRQKGFFALFLAGIGMWFLFDGFVGFPRSNERWLAYDQFKKENRTSEWPAFAKNKGWNEVPPHKLYKKLDIDLQYFIGILSLLAGGWVFIYRAGQLRRVFKLDGDAVIIPGGKRVPLAFVTRVNRKKWEDKGLATVYFTLDGQKGKFILDDYKFDRDPIHEIMTAIEEKLGKPSV